MNISTTNDRLLRRMRRTPTAFKSARCVTKNGGLLLILLSMLGLVFLGVRMFLAGVAGYQADAFISEWEKAANEPAPRSWQVAHDAAQRAIDYYPVADGYQFDRLGRIHSWKQFRQPYADAAAQDSRLAALVAYRAAVAARPNWPYSWARLAHSKRYLEQFDDEFAQALTQAFQLGPWRIGVNRELPEIGFSAWPHLDDVQRQATLESARRVAAHGLVEAQRLVKVAQYTGRTQELCASLSKQQKTLRKICI